MHAIGNSTSFECIYKHTSYKEKKKNNELNKFHIHHQAHE